MKKILLTMFSLVMLVLLGCGEKQEEVKEKVVTEVAKEVTKPQKVEKAAGDKFQGIGAGYSGNTKVTIEMMENKIVNIEVTDHSDTKRIASEAFKKLKKEVIEKQTLDLDTVAGATHSSEGFLEGVKEALNKSGRSLVELNKEKKLDKREDISVDIVIIGGGGAGLTAAVEAKEKGSSVILVEKMPILGGNTLYATGGLNASETMYQTNQDTNEIFFNDTMKGGGEINDKKLVGTLVSKSAEIVKWLVGRGADLSDVGRMGGASKDRTHRPSGGDKVGPNLIGALSKRAEEVGVDIRTSTKAIEIILDDENKIKGIKVENNGDEYNINSKAVIVASGGFGNNPEMLKKLNPSLEGFGTTNHPGATGDALGLLEKLNVATVDMDKIQTHPTVVPVRNTMITEAVRGNGAILINRSGERFINELETRDIVSEAILSQKGKTVYLFFDQGVRDSLKAIESYATMGFLTKGDTIEEIGKNLDISPEKIDETLKKYNGLVESKKDLDYGRLSLERTINKPPFYAIEVGPAVHHTMGGLKIDSKTQVYNLEGNIIKGLFAAGEVTGGVHGGNRLGGNALTDITVFGKIAGDSAVEYITID